MNQPNRFGCGGAMLSRAGVAIGLALIVKAKFSGLGAVTDGISDVSAIGTGISDIRGQYNY